MLLYNLTFLFKKCYVLDFVHTITEECTFIICK